MLSSSSLSGLFAVPGLLLIEGRFNEKKLLNGLRRVYETQEYWNINFVINISPIGSVSYTHLTLPTICSV